MKTSRSLSIVGAVTLLLLASAPFSQADPGDHTLVSVSSTGVPANKSAEDMSLSGDGRYVAFHSLADNLVPNDTNNAEDVFVHDRQLRTTWRVSVSSNASQSNGNSAFGRISRDGRYVAFHSDASNLVANDTNGQTDIFIHDNQTGQTFLVSTTANGSQGNGGSYWGSFSANGRYYVFYSDATNLTPGDTNGYADAFVKDLQTDSITRASVSTLGVSPNNYLGTQLSISADGRFVVFSSSATNLVAVDSNGIYADVFLRDLVNGTTTLISVSTQGVQGDTGSYAASISDDGRYVAFTSSAENLAVMDYDGSGRDMFVRDCQNNTTKWISTVNEPETDYYEGQIDANGRMIVFQSSGHQPTYEYTHVYDQVAGTLELISPPTLVGLYQVAISGDGRVIGYAGALAYDQPVLCYTYEYGDPITMTSLVFNRSTVAGQNIFTGTVTLRDPMGPNGAAMELTSSSSYIQVPSTVSIPPGLSSRTFVVKVFPVDVPKVESVTIRWGTQTLTATVALVPLVPSAFEFTPRPVIGGQPLTVRMVMNGVAPTGGKVVMLSDNSFFATTSASVVVPAKSPQVIFQIQTLPVSSTKYVTITAAVPEGSKTAHFVIRP